MLFNSAQFAIYFPLVVALYFLTPHRWRWPLLLGASYYFYMCWKPEYVVLIMVSTLIDYFAAIWMGQQSSRAKRLPGLLLSLFANLGLLFAFKYFEFFSQSFRSLLSQFNLFYEAPAFHLLLPVGISFYTFQTLSYSIDVYRGERKPEKHLGIFAVYVSFFPQLVAGPIERSTRLMPQFHERHRFDFEGAVIGAQRMLWGFFKKLVIADRLAIYVNSVYNQPGSASGLEVLIATYFFAFQIYCDFSGYSDIAIGAARILGFDLMENFNRPYAARSIREFWHRWHISLSTWFRDYLYIPLGGSKGGRSRWAVNILVVFVLSGLWHGANWTFVVWGGLHGIYFLVGRWTGAGRKRLCAATGLERFPRLIAAMQVFGTFHLVLFAWVFFRAASVADAMHLISMVFWSFAPVSLESLCGPLGVMGMTVALASILILEFVQKDWNPWSPQVARRPALRWALSYGMIFALLLLGVYEESQFIYFQF